MFELLLVGDLCAQIDKLGRYRSAHMAPGIAGSLILFGLALLCAKGDWLGSAISQVLAIAMLAQVLIVLTGYAYGVAIHYYPFPFTAISHYGLVSMLLLAIGLLAASPEDGATAADQECFD